MSIQLKLMSINFIKKEDVLIIQSVLFCEFWKLYHFQNQSS